jgi:hypothetical protein
MSQKYKIIHDCIHCGRQYQRKIYYDRHIICCELLNKSKKERNIEVEQYDDTPKIRELYLIIQEMGKKYVQMEQKLEVLSKYVESKKKRMSIIDWLNHNYKIDKTYSQWLQPIYLERRHLNIVFEHDFLNGILYILQELLPLGEEEKLPIRAFDQKENTLFIYNENKQWVMMSLEVFENLILYISKKLINEFKKWQDENEDKKYNDKFTNIYMENVKKVMGGNFSSEHLYSQIKGKLYRYLKANLKSIVQYEFT